MRSRQRFCNGREGLTDESKKGSMEHINSTALQKAVNSPLRKERESARPQQENGDLSAPITAFALAGALSDASTACVLWSEFGWGRLG
jgi:hypothetical protein